YDEVTVDDEDLLFIDDENSLFVNTEHSQSHLKNHDVENGKESRWRMMENCGNRGGEEGGSKCQKQFIETTKTPPTTSPNIIKPWVSRTTIKPSLKPSSDISFMKVVSFTHLTQESDNSDGSSSMAVLWRRKGACMYTTDWANASLPKSIDLNPVYLSPLDDPVIVCDVIFNFDFKKWEAILKENVISLSRNKDHLNACLAYMLICLANRKPFNLAYYMAKRMVGMIKNYVMVLPYEMLITRLYRHVLTIQPCTITDVHLIMDHVMVPITEGWVKRFLVDGKGLTHKHPYLPYQFSLNLKIKNKSTR
nr:hypothetical protein [Tanacetum cinerariifolium]